MILPPLADRFGRTFPYLRLSVTDVCNFRCSYCLPNGWQPTGTERFLTGAEILRLVRAFAGLGTWKIRLTGGEPSVRRDLTEIIRTTAAVPGIRRIALTTNGYRLAERAESWFDAGLQAINVSIDSLDRARFRLITGHDRLVEVLAGVEACRRLGFSAVKINTVLLRGLNGDAVDDFIDFVADRDLSLRFIELMRTRDNADYFADQHLPAHRVIDRLTARGWHPLPRVEGAGPAQEFMHPDSRGRIGIIAPYAKDFCASCNRLRVSARGLLHLCLFGSGGHDLRPLLQDDTQIGALQTTLTNLLTLKRDRHYQAEGDFGTLPSLAATGG
ncbi:GTP 3',8-cyclase [Elstera cyanobacteriorum]|uniref:GTP 3',8-cyclase MoaA n=1 Tax=Elstera cyanobacteriorum TaxID=2022747 RepID=UPI00199BE00D|nr:GTP 3',8-cyclase MoaA [Elstera cyanobacteriorum]MCK6444709.1 GTP 3',8-cyclase MoaA [Elstera cyanobacteriorum]GFZ90143.1 GTP 3',8-cyclase [Elstera cyanobacteriorum]